MFFSQVENFISDFPIDRVKYLNLRSPPNEKSLDCNMTLTLKKKFPEIKFQDEKKALLLEITTVLDL